MPPTTPSAAGPRPRARGTPGHSAPRPRPRLRPGAGTAPLPLRGDSSTSGPPAREDLRVTAVPPRQRPGSPGPALVRVTGALAAAALALGACQPGTGGAGESPDPTTLGSGASTAQPEVPATLLPPPALPTGEDAALPTLLDTRHSTREFTDTALTLEEVSTLLWAGYGVQSDGGRTVPSAGALYPLDLHLVTGAVDGLPAGVHLHRPDAHSLETLVQGDVRAELAAAALDQESVARAPAVLVVVATPDRLRERYGDRSERFALLEAGHVGQNLALAAQALGFGLVTIGSFDDRAVEELLDLGEGLQVHYLVPVGRPR